MLLVLAFFVATASISSEAADDAVVYSNLEATAVQSYFYNASFGDFVWDDLRLTGGGLLTRLSLIANNSRPTDQPGGVIDIEFRRLGAAGGASGRLIGSVTVDMTESTYPVGNNLIVAEDLEHFGVVLPRNATVMVGVRFQDPTSSMGLVTLDPPTVGASSAAYWVGSDPNPRHFPVKGSFGLELWAEPSWSSPWINASTTDEIIDALVTASRTGTPTTIAVASGHYIFTQSFDTDVGPGVLPPVSSSVWIVGSNSETTILEAGTDGRLFTVVRGGRLVVRNLTATKAGLEGGNSALGGGAAANFGGFLRFDDCRLVRNSTGAERDAWGGAILNVDGRLHIEDSELTGNVVNGGNGGAIALIGGSAIVRNTSIRGNKAIEYMGAGGAGGGIVSTKATLTIIGSTIADNRAGDIDGYSRGGQGGGISSDGALWLRDSAVIGNGVEYIGQGGGIWNRGVMSIKNSTVAANYAGTFGGGIFNEGKLVLQGATLAGNQVLGNVFDCDTAPCSGGGGVWNAGSGIVRTVRSIVAGNSDPFGAPESIGPDCAGVMLSDGYNAIGDASGCDWRPSWVLRGNPTNDLIGVDPALGDLQDNGQAGNAHIPLLDFSPLIDAGSVISKICAAQDQIGQPRVDGDGDRLRECDIGAIEHQLH